MYFVLVPSRGLLHIYWNYANALDATQSFSSPLGGFSISTRDEFLRERIDTEFSSPLGGFSISTI